MALKWGVFVELTRAGLLAQKAAVAVAVAWRVCALSYDRFVVLINTHLINASISVLLIFIFAALFHPIFIVETNH